MEHIALARCGKILIEKCAGIKGNEQVLILTDWEYDQSIPKAIFSAAYAAGAEPVLFTMSPRESSGIHIAGDLPKTLAPAILASDVFFVCTKKRPPIGGKLRNLRAQMIRKGGKALSFYGMTEEMFLRAIPVDYDRISHCVSNLAKLMPEAETTTITAPNGTNISYSTKGRQIYISSDGIALPGQSEVFPAGIVEISPEEGSVNGTIVLDGTLAYIYTAIPEPIGVILEPIICKLKDGRVIEVTGGAQAKLLEKRMKASDENASNFAETYFGCNPGTKPNTGELLEDERSAGVIGIGLGKSTHALGKVESNFHFDATLLHGSLILDGRTVIEDMKIKI